MSEDLVNEISAINSIYGEGTLCAVGDAAGNTPADCILSIPGHDVSLSIRFSPEYPDRHDPPEILGVTRVGGQAGKGYGQHVRRVTEDVLQETYLPGSVCLFNVLETLDARLSGGGAAVAAAAAAVEEEGEQGGEKQKQGHNQPTPEHRASLDDHTSSEPIPTVMESMLPSDSRQSPLQAPAAAWACSDAVTIKKSVFLARATTVSSPVHARACVAALVQTDRHAAKATHNISAYRIPRPPSSSPVHYPQPPLPPPTARKQRGGGSRMEEQLDENDVSASTAGGTKQRFDEDFDDDGESAAGARLLKQLQLMDARGVLVVVSRWYGGVKLGPARFGIICGAGKEAVVRLIEGQGQGESENQQAGGQQEGRRR